MGWSLKIFDSWIFTDGYFHPGIHLAMKTCYCYVYPLNLWPSTLRWHYIWISCSYHLFNKNEGKAYALYKEHPDLYTEIHDWIAVNSCQIELAQKDIVLPSNVFILVYKASERTGMENNKFIHFNLLVGCYSIDHFNTKIRLAILQQRQDWEPPQIKDLKLVIPEHYTFMASNTIFIALGIPENYLEKTMLIRSTLPPGSNKTSLDTSPRPKPLSLYCKQTKKVKNELDGQPSSLLACMHVFNYKATFSPMHLVLLELDRHWPHLNFKILNENNY